LFQLSIDFSKRKKNSEKSKAETIYRKVDEACDVQYFLKFVFNHFIVRMKGKSIYSNMRRIKAHEFAIKESPNTTTWEYDSAN
jgi:hypothetical protein